MNVAGRDLGVRRSRWLICRNEDASKKIVATGILMFEFEFFIVVHLAPLVS